MNMFQLLLLCRDLPFALIFQKKISVGVKNIVVWNRKFQNRGKSLSGKYSKTIRKHIEVGGIYFILLLNFDCKSHSNNMK